MDFINMDSQYKSFFYCIHHPSIIHGIVHKFSWSVRKNELRKNYGWFQSTVWQFRNLVFLQKLWLNRLTLYTWNQATKTPNTQNLILKDIDMVMQSSISEFFRWCLWSPLQNIRVHFLQPVVFIQLSVKLVMDVLAAKQAPHMDTSSIYIPILFQWWFSWNTSSNWYC